MILFPAVDILDGKAVRLRQGDFDEATVYETSPLEAARGWVQVDRTGRGALLEPSAAQGAAA